MNLLPDSEFVIVGGGAVGVGCAYALAKAGKTDVLVIERADDVGAVTTSQGAGLCGQVRDSPERIRLAMHSVAIFRELQASEVKPDWHEVGSLRIALGEKRAEEFRRLKAAADAAGLEAELIDRPEARRRFPQMEFAGVKSVLWCPSDGYVDPHQATLAFGERAAAAGACLTTRCSVTAAERRDGLWHLATSDGPRTADVIVNAAGPWAGQVASLLGLACDVSPQRRSATQVHLATPLDYVHPFTMNYIPGVNRLGAYVRYEAPDRLICGLHSEELLDPANDPDDYPRGVTQDWQEELAGQLALRFPGLADGMAFGEGWSGLYPCRPSLEPSIGWRRETEGVIDAVGFGGGGIQSGPAAGVLVRDWLLHDEPRTIPSAARLAP